MAPSPQILVAESFRFSKRAADFLNMLGEVIFVDADRKTLLERVSEADVLWVRLRHRIDAEVMEAARRLRVIVTPTTGLNHIDLIDAENRSIRILSLRGEVDFLREVRATAEHTIALILASLRRLPMAHLHVCGGGWDRDLFWGQEVHNKTVGVIGYGRLGRLVAGHLLAFGARVLASDPYVASDQVQSGVSLVSIEELLSQSELVTLHVNLTANTAGFFGSSKFELMRPGAWFINTARGELVDERALLKALEAGSLAGAALDVLVNEKTKGMALHPLVSYAQEHDNLIITPHIGGCTFESMEKTELFMAEKLAAFMRDNPSCFKTCAA